MLLADHRISVQAVMGHAGNDELFLKEIASLANKRQSISDDTNLEAFNVMQ